MAKAKAKTPQPIATITVKLVREGAKVINPSTARRLVLGEPTVVPSAPFWHRRLKDGVVELVTVVSEKPGESKPDDSKPDDKKTKAQK